MAKDDTIQPTIKVDIVIPVYNETDIISEFHEKLIEIIRSMPYDFLVIYVDDGSTDTTLKKLLGIALDNNQVTVVELSRNFGHQAALSAGLSIANGDYVITMDGDGQHPPSLIPKMISLAQEGFDIVQTHRFDLHKTSFFKHWTSRIFYKLINFIGSTKLEPDSADFRLLNAQSLLALRSLPEYHLFLRGMVAWMGFRTTILPFETENRIAGISKYSFQKMFRLAMDAMFSFSLMPLYLALLLGAVFLFLAFAETIYVLSFWLSGRANLLSPGWASLMFVLLFIGGTVLGTLGVIGIYVGYIFQEVKHRPIFLVRQLYRFSGTKND